MKIGIYDPYLDDLGGGEKYMISLAECLSADNHVTVFWNRPEDLTKVSERFSLNISKITVRRNIFFSDCSFSEKCLESLAYDAIVVLSDGSIPFVLSKKLFVHFQQPFPLIRPSLLNKLKAARVSSFFCNSFFTKSYIDKEFKINSRVLYPPVNIEIKKTKKENIILHVGRFRAVNVGMQDYKKQGIMIGVFKKMVDKGLKNWKFVLVIGLRDDDRLKFDQLKKKAKGYPIEFLINLKNEDLKKIYSKSKIYWHASGHGEDLTNHPELAEHFGISTVEAMGSGAVPVVINAGGQKEIVINSENGYLWNTLDELMERTSSLINDDKTLEKMSGNAVETSGKFTKEKFCERVKSLIY